jgi:hypothetical protein
MGDALILINLAAITAPARLAGALKDRIVNAIVVQRVTADTAVVAWHRKALVEINITFPAGPSGSAGTFKVVEEVQTDCVVMARVGCALIDVQLAVRSSPAWYALACVGIPCYALILWARCTPWA